MTRPTSTRGAVFGALAAFVASLVVGRMLFGQGLDLVQEGRWLLAARSLLDGTDLHATMIPGDAHLPARLLAVTMGLTERSAAAVGHLLAIVHALVAAVAVGLAVRARGAAAGIAIAVAVWAAVPLPWAVIPTAMFGLAIAASGRFANVGGALAGGCLVLVTLVDPRWTIAALVFLLLARGSLPTVGRATVGGAIAALVVVVLACLAAPSPIGALGRVFATPVHEMIATVDPTRVLRTWWSGAWLDLPFAGLRDTGEVLREAWPAHGALRAIALRAIALGTLIVAAVTWTRGRGAMTNVALARALAVAAVVVLLLRGDVTSLRAVTPLVLAAAIVAFPRRGALAAVLLLPLAAEPMHMAVTAPREGTNVWDFPRGNVVLAEGRIDRLDAMRRSLSPRERESVLVWPELPGVHWILGTDPLVRHLAVPTGDEADAEVADALRTRPPRFVLFGVDRALLGHRLIRALPDTWDHLRANYRLRGRVLSGYEDLRVLTSADDDDAIDAGLITRLPMVELTVSNDRSPALREDFGIGQGFRTAHRDIEGFAFRARTSGTDVRLRMRVQVWQRRADVYDNLIDSAMIDVVVRGDGHVVVIEFPVDDSADRDLAIIMQPQNTPRSEVRLDWKADDDAEGVGDLYPAGDAILGLTPVDADLYFLVY